MCTTNTFDQIKHYVKATIKKKKQIIWIPEVWNRTSVYRLISTAGMRTHRTRSRTDAEKYISTVAFVTRTRMGERFHVKHFICIISYFDNYSRSVCAQERWSWHRRCGRQLCGFVPVSSSPSRCYTLHTAAAAATPAPEQLWSAVVAAKTTRKLCPGAIFFRPEVYGSEASVCVRACEGGSRLQKHLKNGRRRQRRKESLRAANPPSILFFYALLLRHLLLFLHRIRFPPCLSLVFYNLRDQSDRAQHTHALQPFRLLHTAAAVIYSTVSLMRAPRATFFSSTISGPQH